VAKNEWAVLDYIKVGLFGFPYPGLMSVDVTYRCNLLCKHCYFRAQTYNEELSCQAWMELFQSFKKKGLPLYICGWLGGEPLLRPEIVEAGKEYFKSNVIFTNGTCELPDWHDCTFVVSVPGTKEIYSEITGAPKDVYGRVKAHASRGDLRVIVSYCVTKRNEEAIEAFVEEWKETEIQGIFFEFYTPFVGSGSDLWIDYEKRDAVIDRIVCLKREHGAFIYNTYQMLELMRSHNLRKILSDCPFKYVGVSLDPTGRVKKPCAMGEKADCSKCGCILPIFSTILHSRRLLFIAFLDGISRSWRRR
jgi:MoaA/NifB/PqqE/SkfB family radical SAM enzyme